MLWEHWVVAKAKAIYRANSNSKTVLTTVNLAPSEWIRTLGGNAHC